MVERYAREIEHRCAHIHSNAPVIFKMGCDDARHSLDANLALLGETFINDKLDEGTRAIAALFDFTTVGIEDAITEIHISAMGPLNYQNLIGAYTEATVCQFAPLFRPQIDLLIDSVNHNEIIASAVHLSELQFHWFCVK